MSSLIVVRGSYRGTDPNYACTAHDAQPGRYAVIEVEDGRVAKRTIVPSSERAVVEEKMRTFRGTVYADGRKDSSLLPLTAPASAREADFATYRRAKSDDEMKAVDEMAKWSRRALDDGATSTSTFRGAAQNAGYAKSAFTVVKTPGFVQYRGGVQDTMGRCSDLTRVVPRTQEWEERLTRVHRGLDDVEKHLFRGASVAELDRRFMSHMQAGTDVVYGSVVNHIGFEGHEEGVPLGTVEQYDSLRVGVAVSDGTHTALVYRGTRTIQEEEGEAFRAGDDDDEPAPAPLASSESAPSVDPVEALLYRMAQA